ncbi:MAG: quinolinate synthase NadA [candidate division Zixibacteria bacterium]|nr:quinolinate synthase NadA [candidate division Zixibacteria bacterium]
MNYIVANLPDEYRIADEVELRRRIKVKKAELGDKLVILTHHYQRLEIVEFNDFLGDSYALAKSASQQKDAEHIVFCGVRFMAEAADILSDDDKKVYLANPTAGCPMADMAPTGLVYQSWDFIESVLGPDKVLPLSYMNSSAELKAFCGKNGGLICTSSNADAAFDYCFKQNRKLFFFPDQHLGRNTAKKKGIPKDKIALYDINKENGGLTAADIERADVILWSGYCHVHVNFNTEQIAAQRKEFADLKIVVHPECAEEVVDLADSVGSTSHIVNFVEQAPIGSTIAIGTELNLIHRLSVNHPDKKIMSLAGNMCVVCSNMFRTSLQDLCFTLENFDKAELVRVPEDISENAKIALERMLEVGR